MSKSMRTAKTKRGMIMDVLNMLKAFEMLFLTDSIQILLLTQNVTFQKKILSVSEIFWSKKSRVTSASLLMILLNEQYLLLKLQHCFCGTVYYSVYC